MQIGIPIQRVHAKSSCRAWNMYAMEAQGFANGRRRMFERLHKTVIERCCAHIPEPHGI